MKKTFGLFDKVIKKGIEVILLVEKLDDPKEAQRRFEICKSNSGICYIEEEDRCSECTCFMSIKTGMLKHHNPKAKGRTEITHCPLAKWGGEQEKEIANYYRKLDGKELL